MARQRQEILNRLTSEGLIDLNKQQQWYDVPRRIAVISAAGAAGYGDFMNQLAGNPYGLQFYTCLFNAVMQGAQTVPTVMAALERINQYADLFDCVVIIRGGGATSDMSGFDTLALAENVANFPLPIITGIGHDRDESILDMVSHTRVKTPTAAASLLVDHLKQVLDALNDAQDTITLCAQQKLSTLNAQLSAISEAIPRLFSIVKTRQEARLDTCYQRIAHQMGLKLSTLNAQLSTIESKIPMVLERRLTSERHRLEILEEKVHSLDPALLLKRGYSITLFHGKAVRDPQDLKAGDEIETRLEKGTVVSKVLKY
jgi:exodeoxyribonuclease VII large subunit